jgi:hypothetical protein
VAVEVDGPEHFAANVASHVLGPTAAKARCLRVSVLLRPALPWLS